MPHRALPPLINRTIRRPWVYLALTIAAAAPLAAQRSDESRLVVGISAGWLGGGELWQVTGQPIPTAYDVNDTFALRRDMRTTFSLSGSLTYFRGEHLGITGEFTYIGLGMTDYCTLTAASGFTPNAEACAAINTLDRAASAVTVAGGIIYRPNGRSSVQPYFRGIAGIAVMPRSTLEDVSDFYDTSNNNEASEMVIYDDPHWSEMRPTATVGFGIATAPSQGYQLRIEARETWLLLSEVTGATAYQGLVPPSRSLFKGYPSVMVGFDIILEKSRGRRY